VRKQYHLRPTESGVDAWDVDKLIELANGLPARSVDIDSIGEIDTGYWFSDQSARPTVRDVVAHMRLVVEVDPSFPILLGPDGRVLDGMHRVARALLDGRLTIEALQLSELPEPDYRDCRAEDLPYD
jgi:hypothetical protein